MVFSADLETGPEAAEAVAKLCPANPFFTPSYLQAMRSQGHQPWRLEMRERNQGGGACFCYVRAGRINKTLSIPSLPAMAAHSEFWEGLLRQVRAINISRLEVNTYCSPLLAIPALSGETRRRTRYEYIVELQANDLWTTLHENHRRRVRKASKAGLHIQCAGEEKACHEHAALMASSMGRRASRGEDVPAEFAVSSFKPLLESGAGRLYQAVRGNQVLSSVLLLVASQGVYLHSGGTDPEGMDLGASHWLHHELMQALREEGKVLYNLGGTEDPGSGLALFKARFGAQERRLEAVEAFPGTGVRSLASLLARRAGDSCRRMLAMLKPAGRPEPSGNHSKKQERA